MSTKVEAAFRSVLVLPGVVWTISFVVVPIGVLFAYSFLTNGLYEIVPIFTTSNYSGLLATRTFPVVLGQTILIGFSVTAACFLLAFPMAVALARTTPRRRAIGIMALMIPMWSNYLIKIYSWKAMLGTQGAINFVLVKVLGVTKEPADFLLYNLVAVGIALTSALLPFMVLPILTALEQIPRNLLEAASDLGSNEFRTFRTVLVPLARRGILLGWTIVLVVSMGDIIASEFLGGPSGLLVGRLIFDDFGAASDWPRGAAMSAVLLTMMIVILALVSLLSRVGTAERVNVLGSDPRVQG